MDVLLVLRIVGSFQIVIHFQLVYLRVASSVQYYLLFILMIFLMVYHLVFGSLCLLTIVHFGLGFMILIYCIAEFREHSMLLIDGAVIEVCWCLVASSV